MQEITPELQSKILEVAAKNLPFKKYAETVSELLEDESNTKESILKRLIDHHTALKNGSMENDDKDLDFIITVGEADPKVLNKIMENLLDDEEVDDLKQVESLLKNKVNDYFSSSEGKKTPEGLIDHCIGSSEITPDLKVFLVARVKEDFNNCMAAFDPNSSSAPYKSESRSAGEVFKDFLSNTELLVKILTLALVVAIESHTRISARRSKGPSAKENVIVKSIEFLVEEFGISRDNIRGQFKEVLKGFASIISPDRKEKAAAKISKNLAHRKHSSSKGKGI